MIEGATALTNRPSLATSSASATVSAATAVLAAVYAAIPAPDRHSNAGRAATLTMRPPWPPATIAFMAAWQQTKHEMRLLSISAMSAFLSVSPTLPAAKPPARWIEAHKGADDLTVAYSFETSVSSAR